jgi:hypothetical protein
VHFRVVHHHVYSYGRRVIILIFRWREIHPSLSVELYREYGDFFDRLLSQFHGHSHGPRLHSATLQTAFATIDPPRSRLIILLLQHRKPFFSQIQILN